MTWATLASPANRQVVARMSPAPAMERAALSSVDGGKRSPELRDLAVDPVDQYHETTGQG